MGYALTQRLRLIDFLLAEYGYVNRSAVMDYFGVSMPQASMDFKAYMALAPLNMRYDATEKAYGRSAQFVRVFP